MDPPSGNDSSETYHRRRKAMFVTALALVAAWIRLRPFRVAVRGDSMRPTLEPGDWCLATARGRIGPGDVVVFERPDRPGLEIVKRVNHADGDGWFVEGDNPGASTDSREFGAVPRDAIRGRLRLIYWPPRRWRSL